MKPVRGADGSRRGDGPPAGKFPRKDCEKELTKLHVELVKLQREQNLLFAVSRSLHIYGNEKPK